MPRMVPNPNVRPIVPSIAEPMVVESSCPMEADASELQRSFLEALQQADINRPIGNGTQEASAPVQPNIAQSSTDIPDLLSGFERVVQDMNNGVHESTRVVTNSKSTVSQEHSPPFTSRSFDEFHRFLGHDEMSLLDNSANVPMPEIPYVNQNTHVTATELDGKNRKSILPTSTIAFDTTALFSAESYAMLQQDSRLEANPYGANVIPQSAGRANSSVGEVESILEQIQTHRHHRRHHHFPTQKSETMSTHSSFYDSVTTNSPNSNGNLNANPPKDVTISNRSSTVGPLSSLSTTKSYSTTSVSTAPTTNNNRHRHTNASSQSEDVNIVSGSEPSGGSSSSRSNTSNTSSGTDTAGTTSNEDDASDEGLTSSGGEFDSAEDDDTNHNNRHEPHSPSSDTTSPRKRGKRMNNHNKHQSQRGELGKQKRVKFQ
jgi:hypothetical protein